MGNSWIGTLVVLLVIAAQVIPAILQSINKKRREQQAREAAEARRSQQIPEEFRTPLPVEGRGEAPTRPISEPAHSPKVDDLAARRKAQLEQLRNRRDAQRTGSDVQVRTSGRTGGAASLPTSPVPIRTGAQTPGTMRPVAVPGRQAATTRTAGVDQEAIRQRREEARQREQRAAEARRAKQQAAAMERQAQQPQLRPNDPSPIGALSERRTDDVLVAATRRRKDQSMALARLLRQPSAMRQAFVLKELLDAPVSLR